MKTCFRIIYIVTLVYSCSGNNQKESVQVNDNFSDLEADFQNSTLLKNDISAYKTVVNVIRETGLAQNFVILPGNVEQVTAFIKNNERILEYNPEFMQTLSGDTNWYGISVLARQIGHHLSNHELKNGEATFTEELEADKYAGFVLQKMGASLGEAISALENTDKENTDSLGISNKPPLNARLASLSAGWKNAELLAEESYPDLEELGSKTVKVVQEDVSNENPEVGKPQEKPQYSYQIFLAVDTTFYFINENDVVFYETNGKFINVGKKKDSNKPGFDWIFIKGDDSYGVDKKGRLWAFSLDGNFHVVGQAIKLN